MSDAAHRGDHDIAYYEATVGETAALTTSAADTPAFLNDDDAAALLPARYLIQVAAVSDPAVVVWVGFSPFVRGEAPASVAGAGPKRVPLSQSTIIAIETHVLEDTDDRVTVESTGGTATVYVTRVSTVVRRGKRG